jgi:hypothetical protein
MLQKDETMREVEKSVPDVAQTPALNGGVVLMVTRRKFYNDDDNDIYVEAFLYHVNSLCNACGLRYARSKKQWRNK